MESQSSFAQRKEHYVTGNNFTNPAHSTWPHSKSWGYGPTGGLGLIVIILVILVVAGKI